MILKSVLRNHYPPHDLLCALLLAVYFTALPGYTESQLERIGKEAAVAYTSYSPDIFHEDMAESANNIS
jgi:hypothetical protein